MFDIGFGETLLIAAIALIAIGPKQLPEVARVVGRLLNELKRTVGEVSRTITEADQTTRSKFEETKQQILESSGQGALRDVQHVIDNFNIAKTPKPSSQQQEHVEPQAPAEPIAADSTHASAATGAALDDANQMKFDLGGGDPSSASLHKSGKES